MLAPLLPGLGLLALAAHLGRQGLHTGFNVWRRGPVTIQILSEARNCNAAVMRNVKLAHTQLLKSVA